MEAVGVYGIDGDEDEDEYAKGPFYCGLSCVLHIPQFAILLKSPTSTSVNIEVAISFATKNGMIMQINNDIPLAGDHKLFNCNWISNYSDENERLCIGYDDMRRLRIESIRIVHTNTNYELFFILYDV